MANTFPGFRNRVVATDVVHDRIHQGLFYSPSRYVASLGNGASIEFLIRVQSVGLHSRITGKCGGDATIVLYEGADVSSPGTQIIPANRNRFNQRAAETLFYHTPTLNDDGTELDTDFIPGGSWPFAGGGVGPFFQEWILKTGTDYLLRLTNTSGSGQPAEVELDCYEAVGGVL